MVCTVSIHFLIKLLGSIVKKYAKKPRNKKTEKQVFQNESWKYIVQCVAVLLRK